MGRILAIDYGQKRVGLAVSDPMQIIANSLETVSAHEALNFIKNYVEREKVDKFVVGLPKQMNGADSQSMEYITPFVKKMREMFPDIELIYVDERFTSVLAHKTMLDGGLKKKDRQNKGLVDRISATIILQTYLETIRFK
jgi:putative Holliday junction resolvase